MMNHAIAATLHSLRRRLWTLRFIALAAPLIGLFGTCIGIPNAFRSFCGWSETGLSCISGGLLESMVPAAMGILAGTFAHVAHEYSESRVRDFEVEMKCAALELLNYLSTMPRSQRPATI